MADKIRINFSALALLAFLVTIPYLNTFHAPFIFDDEVNITKNTHLQIADLSFVSLLDAARHSPNSRRWLPNITLALNYYFSGKQVFSYHLVNIIIHLTAVFFLYSLFYSLLCLPKFKMSEDKARQLAFISALLWGVHPVNTNAVTYIIQRMTSMAALFYFAAVFFYLRFRTGEVSRRARFVSLGASVLCALMAFASKENTFVLPFAVVGLELYFISTAANRKNLLIAGVGAALFFLLVSLTILGTHLISGILSGYQARDFTLLERLMTEARVIFHYISLLLIPLPSRLNLAYDFPLSTGLLTPPQTVFAMAGILVLVVAVVFLFNRSRLWSFAIFWFLLNLIIESTVIPLELVFEHRLYLSAAFLFLASVYSFSHLSRQRTPFFKGTILIIFLVFSLFTWQRNRVWGNELAMWEDVARKSPGLSRVYVNISLAAAKAKQPWKSIEAARKAIALKPDSKEAAEAWLDIGSAYQNLGMTSQAINAFKRILTLKVGAKREEAHSNLAYTYIRMRRWPQAVEEALAATKINPHVPDGWLNLGVAYGLLGQHRRSEEALRRGIGIAPRDARLYMWLAVALEPQGRYQQALAALDKARGLIVPGDENWAKIKQFRREIMMKSGSGKIN